MSGRTVQTVRYFEERPPSVQAYQYREFGDLERLSQIIRGNKPSQIEVDTRSADAKIRYSVGDQEHTLVLKLNDYVVWVNLEPAVVSQGDFDMKYRLIPEMFP